MSRTLIFAFTLLALSFGLSKAEADYKSCFGDYICSDVFLSKRDAKADAKRRCAAIYSWFTCKFAPGMTLRTTFVATPGSTPAPQQYTYITPASTTPTQNPQGSLTLRLTDSTQIKIGSTKRTDGLASPQDEQDFGGNLALKNNELIQAMKAGNAAVMNIRAFAQREIIEDNEEQTYELLLLPNGDAIQGEIRIRTRDEDHANEMLKVLQKNGQLQCWIQELSVNAEATGETAASRLRIQKLSCIP